MSLPLEPPTEAARLRPKLLGVAYRMLGSAADAEDAVQDAFLKFHEVAADAGQGRIASPEAWLVKTTTRRCIDKLRQAKRREEYHGPWLPEPVAESWDGAAMDRLELAESLTTAFLVLLETLSPTERAVYLLREVFDYEYDDVAALVDKSPANVRQIASRAKKRLGTAVPKENMAENRERPSPSDSRQADEMARKFFAACQSGDRAAIEALLAPEAYLIGDGGGKAHAAPRPVLGAARVANMMAVVFRKQRRDATLRFTQVNGRLGAVFSTRDGAARLVFTLAVSNSGVATVYGMLNPEKLRRFPAAPPMDSSEAEVENSPQD